MSKKTTADTRLDCDIYVRGSYGPSNLGDDVLMTTVSKLIGQSFPTKKTLVSASNPELAKAFLPECDYVDLRLPIKCRIAIFGGGGQFFSFKTEGNPKRRSLSIALRSLSWKSFMQRLIVETRFGRGVAFDAINTAALSVGVGPFENGENEFNFIRAKNNLKRCDFISVRDEMSHEICLKINPQKTRLHTDLSFLKDYWLTEASPSTIPHNKKNQFGVIPRGWSKGQTPALHLERLIEQVSNLEHKPILISLDADNDTQVISSLPDFEWLIWNPTKATPAEFLSTIAQKCDYLVSTRAHGVMLPAALGIPSIAVQIEPKLANIQSYFPNGTTLIKPDRIQQLPEILASFSKEADIRRTHLASEFDAQEKIALQMKEEFLEWMLKHVQ